MNKIITTAFLFALSLPVLAANDNEGIETYAKMNNVSTAEAKRILSIGANMESIMEDIQNEYKGRLAGVYLEHSPEYKLIVRLKGNGKNERKEMAVRNLTNVSIPVEFQYGAKVTKEIGRGQIEVAKKLAQSYFTNVRMVSYNQVTGEIDIDIKEKPSAKIKSKVDEMQAAWKNPNIPLNINFVNYNVVPMSSVYGGTFVIDKSQVASTQMAYDCTTGFGVKNSYGTKYMTTAGHCPNSFESKASGEKYNFVTEFPYSQGNDLQINSTAGTITNQFFVSPTTVRTVTGRRTLPATAVNEKVCHYGNATGYSCDYVTEAGVSVSDFDSVNGYKYPGDFWVYVKTANCGRSDSGGPVFTNSTIASGILSMGLIDDDTKRCVGYLYLPTDKIYEKGYSFVY